MSKNILSNNYILSTVNASKKYYESSSLVLNSVSINIAKGEVIALLGASGSGKSTLLNVMGLLDNLNSGEIYVNGINCTHLKDYEKSEVRKNNLGFVFQFHHLLVDFTVLENVMLPGFIKSEKKSIVREKAIKLLEDVGLKSKIRRFPSELSGGERQRVAIARALVNSPTLILADEPTGNLDSGLSIEICNLIISLVQQNNSAAVIATHDLNIADLIGSKIFLKDGVIHYMVNKSNES